MRTFLIDALVTLAAIGIGLGLARWRHRREIPFGANLSPQWLNENVYEKTGDDRQMK